MKKFNLPGIASGFLITLTASLKTLINYVPLRLKTFCSIVNYMYGPCGIKKN